MPIFAFSFPINAYNLIKKSKSGICHATSSPYYKRTVNFEEFKTIEACLDSNGRLPEGKPSHRQFKKEEKNEHRTHNYNRDDWPHWIDEDNDCQNTRHEVLIATSKIPVQFKADKSCYVVFGEWYDPYSGETFMNSNLLDLDHIVPIKFAHTRGGSKWLKNKKQIFANDRQNLILVKASLNKQKGAKSLYEWLPPNHNYKCQYINKFMGIINKYQLFLFPAEKTAINKMQKACIID